MTAPWLLALALAAPAPARAAAVDAPLQRELERAVAGFHGSVGVYARRLPAGTEAAVAADETFPTASLVKVPILLALYHRLERGELQYSAPLVFESSRAYPGADILASFKEGEKITIPRLAWLTAGYSDNTAALWCQELAGGGENVNRWLEEAGFQRTRVNSRTTGRREQKALYGWGQATPREMAGLFAGLRQGRLLGEAAGQELYRVLSTAYWNSQALSQVPPWVHAASKQGAVEGSRSEVMLVEAPSGPYVLAIMTKDQADRGWAYGNEGFELLRRISRIVWKHYEPSSNWKPPAQAAAFFKEDS